ncbi:MAG: GNAT family N-acetyltransferase [Candidatus Thiodiazotropha weberae]|uniref:GCN5 family acetyltransferase n=1 Tax=Candidatus Thiodiazotropha endoloripes TaxID=1818881 RepID=A0A1E2URS8_9GAMM|nr:GNAT family N-acetyltransferase [Candidatus Thiodiazotropha endoloripes]MCG7897920.1 GNAT family N-acetyltransferase [Candidatus Thiodiazotropha weberae]ODB86336.1 GCN5 family acetyltransferase [Candidatus Thiodiazotropha endoloripes]ODB89816.1 GCN5 family acetyltransferase [Candidatus Thiodiazotropha endoloripes]ODB97456.1 GCN5 family acetyltransferase [Candidatus Thiodiazotropha endoloripes]
MKLKIEINGDIGKEEVVAVYRANGWSSAEKPDKLLAALRHSDNLVTARIDGRLVGIGNAISDGHLVVYYPHMLVDPAYHGQGIGRKMMNSIMNIYQGFHQQMLTSDKNAVGFYQALGFSRAGNTESMWIYEGQDH